jgi:hypothetical protein
MDKTKTLSKTNFTVLPSAIILIVGAASVIMLNVVGIARMHAIANRSYLKLKTQTTVSFPSSSYIFSISSCHLSTRLALI